MINERPDGSDQQEVQQSKKIDGDYIQATSRRCSRVRRSTVITYKRPDGSDQLEVQQSKKIDGDYIQATGWQRPAGGAALTFAKLFLSAFE